MMTITYSDEKQHQRTYSWHIGQKLPAWLPASAPVRVVADGDELYYILKHMNGLPSHGGVVHVWSGTFAAFIVDNMENIHVPAAAAA